MILGGIKSSDLIQIKVINGIETKYIDINCYIDICRYIKNRRCISIIDIFIYVIYVTFILLQ